MNQDLKIIKKKYGESMMHFCRAKFSTLLETKGLLSELLLKRFYPNHDLYDDLKEEDLFDDFSSYILNGYAIKDEVEINESVLELFNEAGYNFYECKSDEDIQYFRKYYRKDEELCTFDEDRLSECYVFFAVKKDVDQIRREDFSSPYREDLYGTSVISIQFTRDPYHILSIKNRYNHAVLNPDATFSNNLDNIISGLTRAFEKDYGMIQSYSNDSLCFFDLNYVKASDGRYYKYNYQMGDIYYCPDNIIIDHGKVKKYPKEKYIVFDYFVLDLVNKDLYTYDKNILESFDIHIPVLNDIFIKREGRNKQIVLKSEGYSDIFFKINKYNQMIQLVDNNVEQIDDDYLRYSTALEILSMNHVRFIGHSFLENNTCLTSLDMPKLEQVGNYFIKTNTCLTTLNFGSLMKTGNYFMSFNRKVSSMYFPLLEVVGDDFLADVQIEKVTFPVLKHVGSCFMNGNRKLERFNAPMLGTVGDQFLSENIDLKILHLPSLWSAANHFLFNNYRLEEFIAPNLRFIGDCFLMYNHRLKKLQLESVAFIGRRFLFHNDCLEEFIAPNLKRVGVNCFYYASCLKKIEVPTKDLFDNDFLCMYGNVIENTQQIKKKKIKTNDFNFCL